MGEMIEVNFTLNGKPTTYSVAPHTSLLRMLRNNYNYDVKCGCENGDCGTCTVLVNGVSVKSCVTLAAQMEGKSVLTVKASLIATTKSATNYRGASSSAELYNAVFVPQEWLS